MSSNPFWLRYLCWIWYLIFISIIFIYYFLCLQLASSTEIDFSSPEDKPVMRKMFVRSPTFPTPPLCYSTLARNFPWHYSVTSPIIVCKQHSQVFRPQDGLFDLFSDKKEHNKLIVGNWTRSTLRSQSNSRNLKVQRGFTSIAYFKDECTDQKRFACCLRFGYVCNGTTT